MGKRTTLSKKLRFDVFDRDNFTCRYCGKTPPDVKLVIDHMMPVKEGGGAEPANLITSCSECNAGKGAKILERGANDKNDRRRAQEYMEQRDAAKLAVRTIEAQADMRASVEELLCREFAVPSAQHALVSHVCNLMVEFDPQTVISWVGQTAARGIHYSSAGRYLSGIARAVRKEGAA